MKREKIEELVPKKVWFTLTEVCRLKNINYKTACCFKSRLQPNKGTPDAMISGRKMFSRETIMEWIMKSDDELKENSLEETPCKK